MSKVRIGNVLVGNGHSCFIVAEIGINHNGDLEIAKKLIDLAILAGADAVKFQKRTPELCVPLKQRDVKCETPWGIMTYMDYRVRIEFGEKEYSDIDRYCNEKNIIWFASCWDEQSLDFISQFDVPCYKIASACLNDDNLLRHTRTKRCPIILSTGMSTLEQIEHAVEVLGKDDLIILQTTSTYPSNYDELNLAVIPFLRKRYGVPVGYSGHETGLPPSIAAVALGASVIERHVTLDRAMWGSDQAASLGPNGIIKLVQEIRLVETSMGNGIKRVYDRELPMMKKLRRKG